ncbi:MAG: ribosome biogenesis GTP-binding protein YihA/YsxC [Eubacteriales bacterium]|nr:ribosome biogenesis GTP-binding protein YihA/YsxC [Clostridiales bacterium]MDY3761029.1 ribosome biogenesis GTP-binding protein YihA/YsxC [Eubacteriales bacterium]
MVLNFQKAEFLDSCFDVKTIKLPTMPEIVFVGRSNVGKSSMINAVLGRKALARTSSTPGKTVSINFYGIDGKVLLTDLPGYGYAQRSKEQRKGWGSLIESYLSLKTRDIRLICMLTDARHEPTKDDLMMYDYLMSTEFLFCVAATKCDKLNKTETENRRISLAERFGTEPIMFSAQTKSGVEQLRQIIEDVTVAETEEE